MTGIRPFRDCCDSPLTVNCGTHRPGPGNAGRHPRHSSDPAPGCPLLTPPASASSPHPRRTAATPRAPSSGCRRGVRASAHWPWPAQRPRSAEDRHFGGSRPLRDGARGCIEARPPESTGDRTPAAAPPRKRRRHRFYRYQLKAPNRNWRQLQLGASALHRSCEILSERGPRPRADRRQQVVREELDVLRRVLEFVPLVRPRANSQVPAVQRQWGAVARSLRTPHGSGCPRPESIGDRIHDQAAARCRRRERAASARRSPMHPGNSPPRQTRSP